MDAAALYHDGARRLQDRFDTRRLADRIAERLARATFSDGDREFIAAQSIFFLATFKSLGNVLVQPLVGLLFVDFASGQRLRVQGRAAIDFDDPLARDFEGAQCIAPRPGHVPPVPAWKRFEMFRDVLPAQDPAREA